jgi:lipoprotein-releasing system ATP-binding protein
MTSAASDTPVIEVIGLAKEYPEGEGRALRRLFSEVSFQLCAGESLAITGPSGCGKSTLLNLIGLLDEPTAGEIRLQGQRVTGLSEKERTALRARSLGFIFQLHHLLPQLTVMENVLVPTIPLKLNRAAQSEAADRARHWLTRLGLAAHVHARPAQLSGGERQRVAIARALINQPKLLLADEPTGALDAANAQRLIDELRRLVSEEGLALITVTHDEGVAAAMSRRWSLPSVIS